MPIHYIGFAGKAQHGKDTAARAFKEVVDSLGVVCDIVPLAKDLKTMASEIWGYSYEDLYVNKPPEVRHNLQRLGTDIIRKRDCNFWINSLAKTTETNYLSLGVNNYFVLVPDIRFINEASFIKSNSGNLFKIIRLEDTFTGTETKMDDVASKHKSEIELDDYKSFDSIFYNVSTVSVFMDSIKTVAKQIIKERLSNE